MSVYVKLDPWPMHTKYGKNRSLAALVDQELFWASSITWGGCYMAWCLTWHGTQTISTKLIVKKNIWHFLKSTSPTWQTTSCFCVRNCQTNTDGPCTCKSTRWPPFGIAHSCQEILSTAFSIGPASGSEIKIYWRDWRNSDVSVKGTAAVEATFLSCNKCGWSQSIVPEV